MVPLRHLALSVSCPASLLARTAKLVEHINSLANGGLCRTKVMLTLKPSIESQLSPATVNLWTSVTSLLYSGTSPAVDLTIVLGSSSCVATDHMDLADLAVQESGVGANGIDDSKSNMYNQVVLGGTFDRFHAGHKILVTTALLRCTKKLTVGVTGQAMLKNKTLPELITPVVERIDGVREFVKEVRDSIECNAVEISDPFGPAIVVPELECIVGSKETEKGCVAINTKRKESGMSELEIYLIELVKDRNREQEFEEEKVSSSSGRMRLLGTRLAPPLRSWDRNAGPYVIGLTGGSASGKSSVGKRMEGLGWGVVDCDRLGHLAYSPGQVAYKKIVEEFGDVVVAGDGNIDRKALGGIVFSDASKLERLNQIVWPEIARLAKEKCHDLWAAGDGCQVVVLDAAVLLEAGWDAECNEVWVCIVPRSEASKRIVDRDGKTEEEAERRINSQLSNQDRVNRANTVLCTLWDPSYTQGQVEKAVNRLNMELKV